MMAKSPPHVVIVGGGIGGLFAANALIAGGIEVSVYEQAPAIGEIGAGVFLTPNSVLCSGSDWNLRWRSGAHGSAAIPVTSATTARR
jgi:flavin-dependent dehydrogenase